MKRNIPFLLAIAVPALLFLTVFSPHMAQAQTLTLRLLIWEGYAPKQVREAFAMRILETYGAELKFNITYASNPEQFFNKLRSGEVDLISPAHNLPKDSRYNLTTNGLTLPINIGNIANYKHLSPDIRYQQWAVENGEVFAVPIIQGPYGLAYNSDVVPPPTSWNVLWDPEYAGRYVVHRDYYELNVYIAAMALGFDPDEIFQYDAIKGPALEDRIHRLAINADSFWRGFDQPRHLKAKALATTWRSSFPALGAQGENWRIAVPREGTTWWIDTLMISHTLKNRPLLRRIAEEWINTTLEPHVQAEAIALELGIFPVTLPGLARYRENNPPGPPTNDQYRLLADHIPWQVLKTRDRNAFQLLWTEALEARATARPSAEENP